MRLPFQPPVLPMLAKRVDGLPEGEDWIFEPKWDGFRSLIFWDGAELYIQSRDSKPLNRYFPDLEAVMRSQFREPCVLDGELVIAGDEGLNFDALQLRVHPAASRVQMLAEKMPASAVFFDLLALGERDLRGEPFAVRRQMLEGLSFASPLHVTPATTDRDIASDWFHRFEGAGLDGVMAKRSGWIYEPDKRVMLKIKHQRECDCVVAGFRWHKKGDGSVGSLLLGLYDEGGKLHHVGVCASFTTEKRIELARFLEPYRENALEGHPWRAWADAMSEFGGQRMPGGQSRWSQGKDLSWEPLRTELVVEVAYEHMQGDRFRHMSQFRRWRTDKSPAACTYEQLEVVPPQELMEIFSASR